MRLLLLILCLSSIGFAQQLEYGSETDLKGLTKIYIDTGGDIKNRNRVIEEFTKAKAGLVVVETLAESEIVFAFAGDSMNQVTGSQSTSQVIGNTPITTTAVNRRKLQIGKGEVFIRGKRSPDAIRMIMNFESTQDKLGEKKPATKFAKEFIKLYKRANQ